SSTSSLRSSIPLPPPPTSTLFPYTTLFRSKLRDARAAKLAYDVLTTHGLDAKVYQEASGAKLYVSKPAPGTETRLAAALAYAQRSEEHTSELQSLTNLVCRLLLEKKNTHTH